MSRPHRQIHPTPAPVDALRSLWLAGLLGLLAAGAAGAQGEPAPEQPPLKEPPQEERPGTYYDAFGKGRGPEGESTAAPVDIDAAPRVAWINPAGGSWSDPGNWSGGAVPGEGDHAVVDLDGTYTVTLDADARITALTLGADGGTQTLALPAHAIALRGPGTIGPTGVLELAGGRITGDGDLIVGGTAVWTGGAMSGRGKARIAAGGRLRIVGDDRKVLSLRHIESSGRVEWSGAGSLVVTFAAQIHNLEQGHLLIDASALLDVYGPAGPAVDNAGTLIKSGSSTTIFEAPLTNSGTVILGGGSLHLLAGYTQTAGSTTLAAAELVAPGGVLIGGGSLGGEGSLKGRLTSSGRIDPDAALEVLGDYTQTADGSLHLDLGGEGNGDRLRISGRATLDGTLEVRWPAAGEPPRGGLEVLTFTAREGDFAAVEGLVGPGGRSLEARWADGALVLE